MGINTLDQRQGNVFGFEVAGKLTPQELEEFLPNLETAVIEANNRLRLLIDVTKMESADVKSEWEAFEFLKKHIQDIEYIAIIGAHSWTKVMSEVLAGSIFVEAETRYFKTDEMEHAWTWLINAAHPNHIPIRKVINSNKGLFTKYGSPDYI